MRKKRMPDLEDMINGNGPNYWVNPDIVLQRAAAAGNLGAIKAALKNDGDVHSRDPEGLTPVQIAAVRGHGPAVMMLLNNGASLGDKNDTSLAALAQQNGHDELAEMLMQWCADNDRVEDFGKAWTEMQALQKAPKGKTISGMKQDENRIRKVREIGKSAPKLK